MNYEVLNLALNETSENVDVIYQALYGEHLVWSRPLINFIEFVNVDGKEFPRFTLLKKD